MTDEQFLNKITPVERKMWEFYRRILYGNGVGYRVLEIGSGWGLFSRFCMMSDPDLKLTTIDKIPDPRHYMENTLGYEGRIERLVGDSKEVLKKFQHESYDIVMIDGDHGYEGFKEDFLKAWEIVKNGGILIIDDIWHPNNHKKGDYGIQKALAELALSVGFSITIYPEGHGIGVIHIHR